MGRTDAPKPRATERTGAACGNSTRPISIGTSGRGPDLRHGRSAARKRSAVFVAADWSVPLPPPPALSARRDFPTSSTVGCGRTSDRSTPSTPRRISKRLTSRSSAAALPHRGAGQASTENRQRRSKCPFESPSAPCTPDFEALDVLDRPASLLTDSSSLPTGRARRASRADIWSATARPRSRPLSARHEARFARRARQTSTAATNPVSIGA